MDSVLILEIKVAELYTRLRKGAGDKIYGLEIKLLASVRLHL